MANSTLAAIQTKVRRLTRSLSPAQLTDAQLNEYINTFIQYDFPEHLRLFNLRSAFTFYTEAFIDVYDPDNYPAGTPLHDFNQKYITVHEPFYVNGNRAAFLESREKLYAMYPKPSAVIEIGTGGPVPVFQFTGTIPSIDPTNCLLRNNIIFETLDTLGNQQTMIDSPISATQGNLYVPGQPVPVGPVNPINYIDYVTGQYTVTFNAFAADGATVTCAYVQVPLSRPTTICFYRGSFIVRPVPDQAYAINMEVYRRPTELLQAGESPELEEWWQYIAYGAAKKIFEDRMDLESVQLIMPEFKKQENLINRRTIVQYTSQRAATIYTEDNNQRTPFGPNSTGGF